MRVSADAGARADTAPTPAAPGGDLEHRIILRFGVSAEFMAKLDRIRALAWHRLPANATLEHVFELVLDDTLKRSDPVTRRELRSRREFARTDRSAESDVHAPASPRTPDDSPQPRHIPLRVRDEVFTRDSGRCTFVGPDGRRCEATRGLQVDHVVPVAQGGSGEIGNLRLLCAQHNRLLAERLFGKRE
jgi:5-methylcytosine-specific restriction endonuclease McrA